VAKTASTGLPALDRVLMNGIPKGFTLLATSAPGAGLDLFAKQFAAAGAKDENVVYFTTSEQDEDIVGTMHDFGWKADITIVNIGNQYYETVLARRLEALPPGGHHDEGPAEDARAGHRAPEGGQLPDRVVV